MKNIVDKIRAATQAGSAKREADLEAARLAAEEQAAQKKRDEAKRLKQDKKTCAEWIENTLPELAEKWAAAGRKKIKFCDLKIEGVYSYDLISECLTKVGLEVEVDRRWVPESRDLDYSWEAHWETTHYLVLP